MLSLKYEELQDFLGGFLAWSARGDLVEKRVQVLADSWSLPAAKCWAEDGGEAGYSDAMELLDLGLHLIGDESEEVGCFLCQ